MRVPAFALLLATLLNPVTAAARGYTPQGHCGPHERVALGMVEQLSGWTLDAPTGVITFTTAPANGVIVRAGFEFDVPVRFDSDTLDVTLDFERLGSITSIPLLEIRR